MMNLYVVGEDNPDPETWARWGGWELVIAPDAETAISMASGTLGCAVCEIPMDKPMRLHSCPDTSWTMGEDL